jgi:2-polyprenyl-6-hydroxyphenyl methylase/3-demethylubiquinone-9 3-methyltransferase
MCRRAALDVAGLVGMTYNPLAATYRLSADTDVNYLLHARRR